MTTVATMATPSATSAAARVVAMPTASTTTFGIGEQTMRGVVNAANATNAASSTTTPALPFPALNSTAHLDTAHLQCEQRALVVHVDALNFILDAFCHADRRHLKHVLATEPVFRNMHYMGLPIDECRELVLRQVQAFVHQGGFKFSDVQHHPLRWLSMIESLGFHGCTLATKASVNFGLFGGTVINLGTAKHHELYVTAIERMSVLGCFALTELGHGSNARAIETTATYDARAQEFVLHTPTESAQKIYIGNLALHANHAVIFAQLTVDGKQRGVHPFVCRIRNERGELLPGFRVKDCGPKMGLNGVDNGRLWLDSVRIPRDALLNRFADVTSDGKYVSAIKSNTKRFTTMISALVYGRITVAQSGLNIGKVGLTIAIKYAYTRRQFGPSDDVPELPLIEYTTHQLRLIPLLAHTYALQFALNKVKRIALKVARKELPDEEHEELSKELHILAAGLKPVCTWHRNKVLQEARECCGGMGYLAANRIGCLKTDSDIDVTWEGDNTVLLQQVTGSLLKEFRAQFAAKGKKVQGAFAYLAQGVLLEVRDKNPITRSNRSSSHLRHSLDFYAHAMEYREVFLLRALVNRMRKYKTSTPFEAWNLNLDLVQELAKAHVDRQLVTAFIEEIEGIEAMKEQQTQPHAQQHQHQPTGPHDQHQQQEHHHHHHSHANPAELIAQLPMLRTLCSLFALSVIQANMAFYMTESYFSPPKAKAIRHQILKLCRLLVPHAALLCDAFGIPDGLLNAPIAGDWLAAYSWPREPGYEAMPSTSSSAAPRAKL